MLIILYVPTYAFMAEINYENYNISWEHNKGYKLQCNNLPKYIYIYI